jgi:polysaccharide chain length determinant protein (PEP-CTERM system associated)
MGNLDLKFYWAVFLRRLPYFLVIVAFLTAGAVTVAMILPPVYTSSASMLVEPQQIPGELAQTTVPVNPYEQAQIIEQRLMTRANLLALANRIGMYEGVDPPMSANAMVSDIAQRITFIGFTPDVTRAPDTPGATILGVSFDGPTAEYANKGANELVNLVLEENVKLRTGRANDTLEFFQSEVDRLAKALDAQGDKISKFKTEHFQALPDSLADRRNQQLLQQQRLLALEQQESDLKNQRATVVWVFERTGRSSATAQLSPEETQLTQMQNELVQQRTIYAPSSPQIRILEGRVAALQKVVDDQRAARSVPGPDGKPAAPASELDVELAPIDSQLKFIAENKAMVEKTLADLDASIQATPANEQVLDGLQRELDNLQNQYNTAVANVGQAQVGERIEVLSKGERFSLIEQPNLPGKPSSPKRKLIAAAGMLGGVVAGLGFILLMELLNHSIRRPVELTARLGIEPFATVPYIRSPGEVRRKRTIIAGTLALIAVALPAVLFAVQTYYMPLDVLMEDALARVGIVPDPDAVPEVVIPGAGAAPEAAAPAAAPASPPANP